MRNNIDVFISIFKPIWNEQFSNVLLCVETILILRQSGYEHMLLMELEKLEKLSKEREVRTINVKVSLTLKIKEQEQFMYSCSCCVNVKQPFIRTVQYFLIIC